MRPIDADALIKELKHITDAYGGDDGDAVFTFYDPLVRRNQLVNMEEFIKRCPTIENMVYGPTMDAEYLRKINEFKKKAEEASGMAENYYTGIVSGLTRARRILNAPVTVPGKWIEDDFGIHCSECWTHVEERTNYCPTCGTLMEG